MLIGGVQKVQEKWVLWKKHKTRFQNFLAPKLAFQNIFPQPSEVPLYDRIDTSLATIVLFLHSNYRVASDKIISVMLPYIQREQGEDGREERREPRAIP